MFKDWRILVIAFLTAAAAPVAADESAHLLVAQLGHSQYAQRTRAFIQLQELGPKAIPALEKGCHSSDLEVRRRCQRLRGQLALSDQDREEMDFLAGKTLSKAPYWKWWKKHEAQLGGDCFGARHFFWNLHKAEPKFFTSLPADLKNMAGLHQKAMMRFQQEALISDEEVKVLAPGPILAFLFLDTYQKQPLNWHHNENLVGFLQNDPGCRHLIAHRLREQKLEVGNLPQIGDIVEKLGLVDYQREILLPWVKKNMLRAVADLPAPEPVEHLAYYYLAVLQTPLETWAEENFKPYLVRRIRECFHQTDFINGYGTIMNTLPMLSWQDEFAGEMNLLMERLLFRPPTLLVEADTLMIAYQMAESFEMDDSWKAMIRTRAQEEIEASLRGPLDVGRFERALNLAGQMEMMGWRDEFLLPGLRIQLHSPQFQSGTAEAQALICLALQVEMFDDVKLLVEPHMRKLIASGHYADSLAQLIATLQNRGEVWNDYYQPLVKKMIRYHLIHSNREKDKMEFLALMNHLNWPDFSSTVMEILQKAPDRSPLLIKSLVFLVRTGTLLKHQDAPLQNAAKLGPLVEVRDVVLFHAVSSRAQKPEDYFFAKDQIEVIWSGDADLIARACLIRAEDRDKAFEKWRDFLRNSRLPRKRE